jgi:alkylhydroperoxidase family enzyme
MPVVNMIEEPESEELRELYTRLEAASQGLGLLNIFKVMAHSPQLMAAWWRMMAIALVRLELPARYRELAILRAFQITGGAYGFAHHVRIGKQTGISDGQIAALSEHETSDEFDAAERLVLRYTDAVTRFDPSAAAIAAEVKQRLSERQLVELTFCIANWNMMAHLLEPLQVELEPATLQYLPAGWRE